MIQLSKEHIKRMPLISAIYRKLYPEYGTCGCCGLPWTVAESHCIKYKTIPYMGFFAVCEYCWQHQPLEEIEEATRRLYNSRSEEGKKRNSLEEMIEQTQKDYERTHNN